MALTYVKNIEIVECFYPMLLRLELPTRMSAKRGRLVI